MDHIHPSDFNYDLPAEKIAKFPLADRSASKLLIYGKGQIRHSIFRDIINEIPQNSLIVFNDTKVIPARLIFYKQTGAKIEIFLLEPIKPSTAMEAVMTETVSCTWKCLIGNAKKWKNHEELVIQLATHETVTAKRTGNQEVTLIWNTHEPFSQVIERIGQLPLPPYLKRAATQEDKPRYQTVYSKFEGAVAAPTAGLHFNDEILSKLKNNHTLDFVTLHVSAGTFQPITTTAGEHPMHREQVIVSRRLVENLLENERVVAVGTTSLRTLESVYWYGVQLLNENNEFFIAKNLAYQDFNKLPTRNEALSAVKEYMQQKKLNQITGNTEIFIVPGYHFKITRALITNFHLPGTTLMMLVAAFVGDDWKKVYQEALNNQYRFLSYGDSSLLFH